MGQAFRIKIGQKYIIPGSLGQMGYAVPAASGVSSIINSNVFCVTGDGSLMTNFHELSVIKKNNFNIKIFLINNGGYMSIRNAQKEFFQNNIHGTNYKTGVYIPKIREIAKKEGRPVSAGYHGIFSTHPSTENRIEAMSRTDSTADKKK